MDYEPTDTPTRHIKNDSIHTIFLPGGTSPIFWA